MKVLKNYTFPTRAIRIPYQEAWFDGNIVRLDETDLGPGNLGSKVPSLKNYAWATYGKRIQVSKEYDDKGKVVVALVLRAFNVNEAV